MIGQTISHYRILEKLGEGGMGVVYKAEDTKLDRLVALKFLPHHLTANESEKARFLQEARTASALNHPHVCTIYGIEEHEGQQFIEMELVDGVTLRARLESSPLKPNDALEYAVQAGEALHEAHSKGIVHRDIKAENIMINSKNQIKVMDFGLAKLKGTLKLTKTSSTVGTLAYMAPEQIQGGEVDARSDIFSFGVVLFEMLTGRLPFRGEHEAAIMYSIVNEEPEPLGKFLPDASSELLHVLNRALEKDPADRYQSLNDLLIDLRRLRRQSAKVNRQSMQGMPIPAEFAIPKREQSGTNQGELNERITVRSKTRVLFVAISAIILVLAVVWLFNVTKTSEASFQSMKITRMTTIGAAGNATISPDGKYIVHNVLKDGKTSLWMRQVATSSSVEIVPAAVTVYQGTTFSNDGNYVFYVTQDAQNPSGSLFQVPVLGGTPKKILTNIRTPISLSPDGKQCTFVRQNNEAKNEEALFIVNLDGTMERKLVSRFGEEFFIPSDMGPSWSPDGKWIATCVGTTKGGFQSRVAVYSVSDGREEFLSPRPWSYVGRVVWLHDGSGIMLAAVDTNDVRSQLWLLDFPGGTVRRVTNDLNSYGTTSLGLTADDQALVTVQTEQTSNIWIVPDGNAGQAKRLTSGTGTLDGSAGVAWTPDGQRIVYASTASGNNDIWIMDRDGSNQKQLTTDPRLDVAPSVTPDGNSIIFASGRTGTSNIWMMDVDGSNVRRLTTTEDYFATCTPDGKWVVYYGFGSGYSTVWKIPITGGAPVELTKKSSSAPAVSPDGKLVACSYQDKDKALPKIAILSIDGGEPIKLLDLPATAGRGYEWSADGKAVLYRNTVGGVTNIWSQPIDGSSPKQITNFIDGLIFSASVTPDGKQFVCARGNTVSDVVMITGFR